MSIGRTNAGGGTKEEWVTVFTPKGWESNEYVPTLEEIQQTELAIQSPVTRTNPSDTTNMRWAKNTSGTSGSLMYLNFPSSVKKARVYYRAYSQNYNVNVLLADCNKTTTALISIIQTLAGGYTAQGVPGPGTFANVIEYEPTETTCFRLGTADAKSVWLEIYAIEVLI